MCLLMKEDATAVASSSDKTVSGVAKYSSPLSSLTPRHMRYNSSRSTAAGQFFVVHYRMRQSCGAIDIPARCEAMSRRSCRYPDRQGHAPMPPRPEPIAAPCAARDPGGRHWRRSGQSDRSCSQGQGLALLRSSGRTPTLGSTAIVRRGN